MKIIKETANFKIVIYDEPESIVKLEAFENQTDAFGNIFYKSILRASDINPGDKTVTKMIKELIDA